MICSNISRLAKQITTHLGIMKNIYQKLESLQAECTATRTSRLTHYIIYGPTNNHGGGYLVKHDNSLIRG